jgi:hypothetical protein
VVKQLLSFGLLLTYISGLIQPNLTLIDFYLYRDDYTLRFCEKLDEGITTCRASCYLDKLIAESQKADNPHKLAVVEKVKSPELVCHIPTEKRILQTTATGSETVRELRSQGGIACIFHPPKSI